MAVIKVPDISIVKSANGVKQLFSLRGQRVKKGGVLNTFGAGSGVVCDGDLYVLEEAKAIVTMRTAKESVSFTVTKTSDITVDWGDGIKEKNVFSHSYGSVVEHEIRFYGKNVALTYLGCYSNQLSVLDVSANVGLMSLSCHNNQLTTLDVSANVGLTYLHCAINQLTFLDMSTNKSLTELYCYGNQLAFLDVSGNVVLKSLGGHTNQLTFLDVSTNTGLVILDCQYNQLTALDVSANTRLENLYFSGNVFINNTIELTNLANSLVNRAHSVSGHIIINNASAKELITPICTEKNWGIE